VKKLISILLDMNAKELLGVAVFVVIFIGLHYLSHVSEVLLFFVVMIIITSILGFVIGGLNDNKELEEDPCGNDNIRRRPWDYM